MSAVLFLDDKDIRFEIFSRRYRGAIFVKTSKDAIEKMTGKYWDVVSLDRDLDVGDSGERVVDWIITHAPAIGGIIIHSTNMERSIIMIARLRDRGYVVRYDPIEVDLP